MHNLGARPSAGQETVTLSSVTVTGPARVTLPLLLHRVAVADHVADRIIRRRCRRLYQRERPALDRRHRLVVRAGVDRGSRPGRRGRWPLFFTKPASKISLRDRVAGRASGPTPAGARLARASGQVTAALSSVTVYGAF